MGVLLFGLLRPLYFGAETCCFDEVLFPEDDRDELVVRVVDVLYPGMLRLSD